jgi:hypothetical protein
MDISLSPVFVRLVLEMKMVSYNGFDKPVAVMLPICPKGRQLLGHSIVTEATCTPVLIPAMGFVSWERCHRSAGKSSWISSLTF